MIYPLSPYYSNDEFKKSKQHNDVPQHNGYQREPNELNPRNMNVLNFTKQLLLPLLLLVVALSLPEIGHAQEESDQISIVRNTTLEYEEIYSSPYSPQITQAPQHGTTSWLGSTNSLGIVGENTLYYTPNSATFLGQDTLQIGYWKSSNFGPIFTKRYLYITVEPSIVIANDDYTATDIGQSVVIDVLANDEGNSSILYVKSPVLLVNNGSAIVQEDGTVLYTPEAGFEGLAHLNYISCDSLNTCDLATVSICVYDSNNPQSDTLVISTPKNTAEVLLMPIEGYTLVDGSATERIDFSGEVTKYIPAMDFVGQEEFVFENVINGLLIRKTVIINVLDVAAPNNFANDDYFYITEGSSLDAANILNNDLGGQSLGSITIISDFSYADAKTLDNSGTLTYTPEPGFTGVDELQYQVFPPGNVGTPEIATVYVYVSNQAPSATTFYLTTPKNTPLVLGYGISVVYHGFNVTAQASMGQAEFHDNLDQSYYNGLHHITGERVLVYAPTQDAVGQDEFEIEYCVTSNTETCIPVKVYVDVIDVDTDPSILAEQICYSTDCVWAGDTNNDGVVNMEDLLPIGLCMGQVGNDRFEPNLDDWYGQYGENWVNEIENLGLDIKYIDTDGNGVVSAVDTTSISQFYGRQHSITPEPLEEIYEIPWGFFAGRDTVPLVGPGAIIELPIFLGHESFPAIDIYGLTFDYDISYEAIESGSGYIDFASNSWMSYNSPVLNMFQQSNDILQAGYTRTSGLSASGSGIIGRAGFVIVENLDGLKLNNPQFTIRLTNVKAMDSSGKTFRLPDDEYTFELDLEAFEDKKDITEIDPSQVKVYPNPSTGVLNVDLYSQLEAEALSIYTVTGQEVYRQDNIATKKARMDVSHLENGIYFVQVQTTHGAVVHKKFEVMK